MEYSVLEGAMGRRQEVDSIMDTEQAAAEAIAIEYDDWKAGRRSAEPELTAARVAFLVNPRLFEESPKLRERKLLLKRISSALDRMRKAGVIGHSLGWWRGREVRMYEPDDRMRKRYSA